jgi:hypothetical protein
VTPELGEPGPLLSLGSKRFLKPETSPNPMLCKDDEAPGLMLLSTSTALALQISPSPQKAQFFTVHLMSGILSLLYEE